MIALTDADKLLTTNKARWTPSDWGYRPNGITMEEGRSVLDFTIEKKPNYAYDPVRGMRPLAGSYHLERDDGDIIPSAALGEQFSPLQHRDVYDFVTKEIIPNVQGMKLELVGTFHHGATGIIAATLGDAFQIDNDKSPSTMRILYANPCNGTGRLTLGMTQVRIVCQNTLRAAIRQADNDGFAIKHTKGIEVRVEAALKQVKAAANAALEMKERANILAHIGADSYMLEKALDALLPLYGLDTDSPVHKHMVAKREEVIRQFESGETAQTMVGKTAWSMFNAFTYPVFNSPRLTVKSDLAQVQYKGMVGETSRKVKEAFITIENIAKYAA